MEVLIVAILVLGGLSLLLWRVSSGKNDRGEWGEEQTASEIESCLDGGDYKAFHNIIIPSVNGTAQLDHLIISKFGVFIIETKCLGGWIFGDEKQRKWTQVLFKRKYSFQNPLKQAYRQKVVLSNFLQIDKWRINTIIYFVGDCEFKTPMPDNVLQYGLSDYIESFQEEVLPEKQVQNLVDQVKNHVESTPLTLSDHVESLQERHSSTEKCPSCGSYLFVKEAKNGTRAGRRFLGCSNFPRCRFTRSI